MMNVSFVVCVYVCHARRNAASARERPAIWKRREHFVVHKMYGARAFWLHTNSAWANYQTHNACVRVDCWPNGRFNSNTGHILLCLHLTRILSHNGCEYYKRAFACVSKPKINHYFVNMQKYRTLHSHRHTTTTRLKVFKYILHRIWFKWCHLPFV